MFQGEAYGTTWQVKFYETETKVNKDYLLKTIQQELKNNPSITVAGGTPQDWSKLTFTDLVDISNGLYHFRGH